MTVPVTSTPYAVVSMPEADLEKDSSALVLWHSYFDAVVPAAAVASLFIGIAAYLLYNIADMQMPMVSRIAMVVLSLVIAVLLVWYPLYQGLFAFAATDKGLYYRSREDKSKLVFIPWGVVRDVGLYGDDLEIQTTLEGAVPFPHPCNGKLYVEEGQRGIAVWPGLFRKRSALKTLNAIKQGLATRKPESSL